jgi:hypothetical protein
MVDRLNNAEIVSIEGESYRAKEARERSSRKQSSAAAESPDQTETAALAPARLPALRQVPVQSRAVADSPTRYPDTLSAETALAVFELVDEIRDIILAVYRTEIQEAARQRCQPSHAEKAVIPDDDSPF